MTRAGFEFSPKVKDQAAARAKGYCEGCGLPFNGARPEYDHILPIALKGKATLANCRALCRACHRAKTTDDVKKIRKADRQRKSANGAKRRSGRSIAGNSDGLKGPPKTPKIDKAAVTFLGLSEIARRYEATHD